MSIKNDGHYFCRAGGNRPDGLNEPVTWRDNVVSQIRSELKSGSYRTMAGGRLQPAIRKRPRSCAAL
ncbi:hypothetical protein FV438_26430 [Escherichia coli]|nr:hypothetical protein FV438_26430 [Escherichia coli]